MENQFSQNAPSRPCVIVYNMEKSVSFGYFLFDVINTKAHLMELSNGLAVSSLINYVRVLSSCFII